MGFDWLTPEHLAAEWRLATGAPVLLLATALISGSGAYLAAKWKFGSQLEQAESRLKLRDDEINDYKRKLGDATPDELRARIEALEKENEGTVRWRRGP